MDAKRLDWTDGLCIGTLAVLAVIALIYVPFGWDGFVGLFKSQSAAAWVQAVGSLLGLAIAIAVPVAMNRRERSLRREEELVTAKIVAVGVHFMLPALVGAARVIRDRMAMNTTDAREPHIPGCINVFDALVYPNEWQMLQIGRVSGEAAIALAIGCANLTEVHRAFDSYRGRDATDFDRAHMALLRGRLQIGIAQMEKAKALLGPFAAAS